jgi:hypothetical protein
MCKGTAMEGENNVGILTRGVGVDNMKKGRPDF